MDASNNLVHSSLKSLKRMHLLKFAFGFENVCLTIDMAVF